MWNTVGGQCYVDKKKGPLVSCHDDFYVIQCQPSQKQAVGGSLSHLKISNCLLSKKLHRISYSWKSPSLFLPTNNLLSNIFLEGCYVHLLFDFVLLFRDTSHIWSSRGLWMEAAPQPALAIQASLLPLLLQPNGRVVCYEAMPEVHWVLSCAQWNLWSIHLQYLKPNPHPLPNKVETTVAPPLFQSPMGHEK